MTDMTSAPRQPVPLSEVPAVTLDWQEAVALALGIFFWVAVAVEVYQRLKG